MPTKSRNQKTIEKRLRDILLEIYQSQNAYDDGTVDAVHLEQDIYRLKSLISDLLREVIGEDIPNPYDQPKIEGINYEKQEIRQRAKKLGLEV